MRTLRLFSPLLLLLLFTACGDVGDAPEATTGDAVAVADADGIALAIDTSQSEINWKGAKVTRSHDGGFHVFDGTVYVNDGQVQRVEVNIDATSIWSDTERLTGHLMSDDFFGVETNPTAEFVASEFAPTDSAGATHLVTGNLTMAGQTNSVTFPATISVEEGRVTAQADFIINRQNWGITYPGQPDDLISDEIRILFDIVASEPAAPLAGEAATEEDVVDEGAPVTE